MKSLLAKFKIRWHKPKLTALKFKRKICRSADKDRRIQRRIKTDINFANFPARAHLDNAIIFAGLQIAACKSVRERREEHSGVGGGGERGKHSSPRGRDPTGLKFRIDSRLEVTKVTRGHVKLDEASDGFSRSLNGARRRKEERPCDRSHAFYMPAM